MKQSNLIILAVVGIAGFVFYDKLKNLFGGATTEENNKKIQDFLTKKPIENPFDKGYIAAIQAANPGKVMHYMKGEEAKKLAKQIYDSVGFWTGLLPSTKDYTHEIQAAFTQIRYKTQVAQLATIFNQMYKKDLLTFLQYDTDKYGMFSGSKHADIVKTILQRVNNLPAY
jgi:hypothetical protein